MSANIDVLNNYVTQHYGALKRTYGEDVVNDSYIHLRRVMGSPRMAQPTNVVSCMLRDAYLRKLRLTKTGMLPMYAEGAYWPNEYAPDYWKLHNRLEALPPQQRKYLDLWVRLDLTYCEIALLCNSNAGTVKATIRQALLKIKGDFGL